MRTIILAALLALLAPMTPVLGDQAPADVRVLIDISGSMRQNDPKNLRRPALRMLVGLLQPGTQAGVWTFARWVNMLVPHGEVDAAWKQRAISLSEQIASPGQFTNIEEALDRATRSWEGGAGDGQPRDLVLLTDGMVDVSKDAAENAASRARVLDRLLPRIKAAGARIHAVALSDRADHELLQQLAAATDGWYEQVDSADDLQRVFLRLFEKVSQPDGVPLADNRFQVDRSIHEATVLAFRGSDAQPTRLHAPDGTVFAGSDLPAGVAWYRDQGYDLITISDPAPGEWRLEADVDPDNRVMVVTDLRLDTSDLPNRLAVGESLPISAWLTNKGQVVDRRAFLDLVHMLAETGSDAGVVTQEMSDDGEGGDEQAGDGRYGARLQGTEVRDALTLRVRAESSTFMREKHLVFKVVAPADLTVADSGQGAEARLTVDRGLLPEVRAVTLWQTDPQGQRVELSTTAGADDVWTAPLQDAAWPVHAEVLGDTRSGQSLSNRLGPVYAEGVTPPSPPVTPPPVAVPEPAPPLPEATVPVEDDTGDAAAEDAGWLLPLVIFGGVNLLVLVGGGLGWWLWRRRHTDAPDLLEELPDAAAQSGPETPRKEAA